MESTAAPGKRRPLALAALIVAGAAFLAIYLGDVGAGFFKDDFVWIAQSRVSRLEDIPALLGQERGFYRPLVALSFSLDYALHGLRPFGYGLTNLALLLAAALVLASVARGLGLGWGASVLSGCLWAWNPHGINMALLWISGRTSLLLCLFALLTARAALRGERWPAATFFFLALLSREDALLLLPILPFLLSPGTGERLRTRLGSRVKALWPLAVPLLLYLGLRFRTKAFLPHTAPDYYRFDLHPLHLLRNALEYLDRSATFPILLTALLMLLLWRLPRPDGSARSARRALRAGLSWLLLGLGLAVCLPVRSSLYAVFPAIGGAMAAAALCQSLWRQLDEGSRRRLLVIACLLPLILVPVWRARNVRWTRGGEESRQVVRELQAVGGELPATGTLVLIDRSAQANELASVFGYLLQEGVRLASGREGLRVWLEPPLPGWEKAGLAPPAEGAAVVRLVWQGGRLSRLE